MDRLVLQLTRVLATFAVAVGLLAMHGLAETHHAPAAAPVTSAAAVNHAHPVTHAPRTATEAGPALAIASAGSTLPSGCDGGCSDDHSLLMLCLAVLAATALLLARLPARRWPRAPVRVRTPIDPRRAGLPARNLDPVSQLCVSRT